MPPKQKAIEKKAENEAVRKQREDQNRELQEAANWAVGAKDGRKQREDEEKDAERRRRAAEKSALEAQEQAELSQVQRAGKPKKKGKDDFDFLKAALASQPQTKAQKEAEKKKQADEERKRKEAEAAEEREAKRKAEEEYVKKMAAKGIVVNHTDELFVPLNNHLDEEDFEHASGLDGAIDVLSINGGKADEHPERRQKVCTSLEVSLLFAQ